MGSELRRFEALTGGGVLPGGRAPIAWMDAWRLLCRACNIEAASAMDAVRRSAWVRPAAARGGGVAAALLPCASRWSCVMLGAGFCECCGGKISVSLLSLDLPGDCWPSATGKLVNADADPLTRAGLTFAAPGQIGIA